MLILIGLLFAYVMLNYYYSIICEHYYFKQLDKEREDVERRTKTKIRPQGKVFYGS